MHYGSRSGSPHSEGWFHGIRPFPRRKEYLEMLDEYKKRLEEELKEVASEIEELKGN